MTETAQLALPLLAPSQAQKHVTVNEALVRLDGLAQVAVVSRTLAEPPAEAAEGSVFVVPENSSGDWAGRTGALAIRANGGWVFTMPKAGWRAFLLEEGAPALHDGSDWVTGMVSLSPAAAGARIEVLEFDHVLSAGGAQETEIAVPGNSVVFGVTGRVTASISGSLSGWSLGAGEDPTRFGSGLGTAAESWVRGLLSTPTTQYAPIPLILTPDSGDFSGGTVRLSVHYLTLQLPRL